MSDLTAEAQGHIEQPPPSSEYAAAEYTARLESLAARNEVIRQHLEQMHLQLQ